MHPPRRPFRQQGDQKDFLAVEPVNSTPSSQAQPSYRTFRTYTDKGHCTGMVGSEQEQMIDLRNEYQWVGNLKQIDDHSPLRAYSFPIAELFCFARLCDLGPARYCDRKP